MAASDEFRLVLPGIAHEGKLPRKYTAEGQGARKNISPPVEWYNLPPGTKSLALVVEIIDSPDPNDPVVPFTNWVVVNIPPGVKSLPEGFSGKEEDQMGGKYGGLKEGNNDLKVPGWCGPKMPSAGHRFEFKLYALDDELNLGHKIPTTMFKKNPTPKASPVTPPNEEIVSELRPGGMCVQRRDYDDEHAAAAGAVITIHVTHGPVHHVINLPAHSTFGELKGLVSQKTGLEPEEQKLLFRGKEKEDEEHLDAAGVKDNSRVMLLQEPKRKERSVGEVNENNEMEVDAGEVGVGSNEMEADAGEIRAMSPEMAKAFEAIAGVRAEVDGLSDRVSALDAAVNGGTKVSDKEFAVSTELLMRQLLKLDGIKAEGGARMQRKAEVRRVQNLVDTLDDLKVKNSDPINNDSNGVASQNSNGVNPQNSSGVASQNGNAVSVTTKWETFDSGVGSLTAPTPVPSSTEVTEDWQKFD